MQNNFSINNKFCQWNTINLLDTKSIILKLKLFQAIRNITNQFDYNIFRRE